MSIPTACDASVPAVVARSPQNLDVFVVGNDGHVYTSAWGAGGAWSGIGNKWWDIGGVFPVGAPLSVVSRNPNQLDVFVTGIDGHVYTSAWAAGGAWSGIGNKWWDIGGVFPPGAPVCAVSRNPYQLDLFVVGYDGHVYTSAWSAGGAWSGIGNKWWDIGGIFPVGATVSAVSRNPNQLDVFIMGGNGHVYTSAWSAGGAWSGIGNKWWDIGGTFPVAASLSVVSRNPNQLDVFVTGGDGQVYTSAWSAGGAWSGIGDKWWDIGGIFPPGAPVCAVSRDPNQLDVFIMGGDGHVYTSAWSAGGAWSGIGNKWWDIGGTFPVANPVAAVSRNPGQLDVFTLGSNGDVYTSAWSAGGAWSGIGNKWWDIGGVFPASAPAIATFTLTLVSMEIDNTRSRHEDTDYVSYSVAWNNQAPQTRIKSMGNLNNGTFGIGLSFTVSAARYLPLVMNYLIINSGHQSQSDIDNELTQLANQLASAGAKAAASAISSGIGALAGASIGTAVAPIIGSALGALAGWIVGEVGGLLFADCDGPVAAEQVPFAVGPLWLQTRKGAAVQHRTEHPGTNSPDGCGSNSLYYTTWVVNSVDAH